MARVRPNPKLFGSSYKPPKQAPPKSKLSKPQKRILVLLLVLGLIFIIVPRLGVFRIDLVEVVGSEDQRLVEQVKTLEGHSIFSGKVSALVHRIRLSHREISSFNCSRGLPNSLKCRALYRSPVLIWQVGPSRYLVDEAGFVFASFNGENDLITIEDVFTQSLSVGQTVASRELIGQYLNLVSALRERSITVNALSIGESLYQVSVKSTLAGKEVTLTFSLTEPLSWQLSSLEALLASQSELPWTQIDLRVAGYIYLK